MDNISLGVLGAQKIEQDNMEDKNLSIALCNTLNTKTEIRSCLIQLQKQNNQLDVGDYILGFTFIGGIIFIIYTFWRYRIKY